MLILFLGVLIAKKALFRNAVPDGCGGGTVLYVSFMMKIFLFNTFI